MIMVWSLVFLSRLTFYWLQEALDKNIFMIFQNSWTSRIADCTYLLFSGGQLSALSITAWKRVTHRSASAGMAYLVYFFIIPASIMNLLAHSGQKPWENCVSECSLIYFSNCCQLPSWSRIFLHWLHIGRKVSRTLTSEIDRRKSSANSRWRSSNCLILDNAPPIARKETRRTIVFQTA